MLKNTTILRLIGASAITPGAVEELISKHPVADPTGIQTDRRGWAPPLKESSAFVHGTSVMVLCVATRKRLLPPAVVNQQVDARAKAFEEERGYKPGTKQRAELKEAVETELLPKAFIKEHRVQAVIDFKNGWVYVGSTSTADIDDFCDLLKLDVLNADGGTKGAIRPWGAGDVSFSYWMTTWVADRSIPEPFHVGRKLTLLKRDEETSAIRYANIHLTEMHIRDYIALMGFRVSQLEITWNHRLCFVLNTDGQLSSIESLAFLGSEPDPSEDPVTRFCSDAEIFAGTINEVVRDLMKATSWAVSNDQQQIPMPENKGEDDPLYDGAVTVVRETDKASISWIQRKLKVGYNRAARLVERMEQEGVVSPIDERGQREVLPA